MFTERMFKAFSLIMKTQPKHIRWDRFIIEKNIVCVRKSSPGSVWEQCSWTGVLGIAACKRTGFESMRLTLMT